MSICLSSFDYGTQGAGLLPDVEGTSMSTVETRPGERNTTLRGRLEMLGDKDAMATIAVKDIQVAKKFYEGDLGLKQVPGEESGALVYKSGKSTILVYESQYAGTNRATAATWTVGEDVEKVVQALKAKGVDFEHYDMPGMTRRGDVHVGGSMKAAWFKDPDGNILALVSG